MERTHDRRVLLALATLGCIWLWHVGSPVGISGHLVGAGTALAAESLNIEGLPKDARAYRAQVDQILRKVDGLIDKLKENESARALILDLEQTRDNILREIPKMEIAPGDAKWGSQEMRDSVQQMLKLLKDQYEKAVASSL